MDAIVTDAHTRTGVAGMRGLGRRGVDVLALGAGPLAAGLWSRYASARAIAPLPERDPAGFIDTLARLADRHGSVVVYPSGEASIDAVLNARSMLPALVRLPYPGAEPLRLLRDKPSLAQLAADVSLTTPRTLFTGSVGALPKSSFPSSCVIKPARPGGALATARAITCTIELHDVLTALPAHEEVLVQERLTGRLGAVAVVLARDGRLLARFQQRASRTWPRTAGASGQAMSIAPDETFICRIAAMLRAAGYWGLAEVQYLEDSSGAAIIDVNPRFYGSLPLALACGVNLPAAWHAAVADVDLPSPTPYRVGVTYRWLESDVLAAARGRPQDLLRLTRRPVVGAIWAGDDPVCSAMLALNAVHVRTRAAARRLLTAAEPLSTAVGHCTSRRLRGLD